MIDDLPSRKELRKQLVMTCQIILANGHGVVLASDSAVTSGQRVRNGIEKMFPIAYPHRVAVLQTGNVELHGVPFQILIEEWAASLGNNVLDSVEDYQESFAEWVRDNRDRIRTPEDRESETARRLSWIVREVKAAADEFLDDFRESFGDDSDFEDFDDFRNGGTAAESDKALQALLAWIDSSCDAWLSHPDVQGLSEATVHRLFGNSGANFGSDLDELVETIFEDYPGDPDLHQQILSFVEVVLRKRFDDRSTTTLTFAGFGGNELSASVVTLTIQGFVLDDLVVQRWELAQVPNDNPRSLCIRRGQTAAVEMFLSGYSSELVEQVGKNLQLRAVNDSDDLPEPQPVTEVLRQQLDELSDQQRWNNFWDIIDMLPINDLAETARRLINIQSLDFMLQGELETVSPDCVVAVITPSRGFRYLSADRVAA